MNIFDFIFDTDDMQTKLKMLRVPIFLTMFEYEFTHINTNYKCLDMNVLVVFNRKYKQLTTNSYSYMYIMYVLYCIIIYQYFHQPLIFIQLALQIDRLL